MLKDIFTKSPSNGMRSATCLVSLEPNDQGWYEYRVIHTTSGMSGAAKSLSEAIEQARAAAKGPSGGHPS